MENDKEKINTLSPQDVASLQQQLKDAQEKITKQAEDLRTAEKFIGEADALAQVINKSDTLKETFKKEWARLNGVSVSDEDNKKSKEDDKTKPSVVEDPKFKELYNKVESSEKRAREKAIKEFEQKYGISGLSKEEVEKVRSKIGEKLSVYGQTIEAVPLDKLDTVLDASYKAVVADKAAVDKDYEAMASAYTNLSGSFGSVNGRATSESTSGLTDGQKGIAEKWGLDLGKVEKAQEYTTKPFVPEAEKNAKKYD